MMITLVVVVVAVAVAVAVAVVVDDIDSFAGSAGQRLIANRDRMLDMINFISGALRNR